MIQHLEHTVEEIMIEFTSLLKDMDAVVEDNVQHWLDEIEMVYSEEDEE